MGPPKPSKRDSNGYFDKGTGRIKGAKSYSHANMEFNRELPDLVKKSAAPNKDYAHHLCNIAPVCKEGVGFKGTIGGENCTQEEVLALIALLDQRVFDNVFKLGLGKPLGLGSVSSRIDKIWLRRADTYTWEHLDMPANCNREEFVAKIAEVAPQLATIFEKEKLKIDDIVRCKKLFPLILTNPINDTKTINTSTAEVAEASISFITR